MCTKRWHDEMLKRKYWVREDTIIIMLSKDCHHTKEHEILDVLRQLKSLDLFFRNAFTFDNNMIRNANPKKISRFVKSVPDDVFQEGKFAEDVSQLLTLKNAENAMREIFADEQKRLLFVQTFGPETIKSLGSEQLSALSPKLVPEVISKLNPNDRAEQVLCALGKKHAYEALVRMQSNI